MTDHARLPDLFDELVGEWFFIASHPMLEERALGRSTFEWLEGRACLIQRSSNDHPDIPNSISVIGPPSADVPQLDGPLMMSYHDSRGVHRIYAVSVDGRELRFWRDAPEFDQRYSATLSDHGEVFDGLVQMRRDGGDWTDDLAITYRRAE